MVSGLVLSSIALSFSSFLPITELLDYVHHMMDDEALDV